MLANSSMDLQLHHNTWKNKGFLPVRDAVVLLALEVLAATFRLESLPPMLEQSDRTGSAGFVESERHKTIGLGGYGS